MRKPVLCHMRTTKAQISLHIRIEAGLSLAKWQTPEDSVSCDVAQFMINDKRATI